MKKRIIANVMLLIISVTATTISKLFLPRLLYSFMPLSILDQLESLTGIRYSREDLSLLIIFSLYLIAGCVIGIKAKTYKKAVIKSVIVSQGFFLSLLIIDSLHYNVIYFFALMLGYFIHALPWTAIVIVPALLLRFLCSRTKLNRYALIAITTAIIIVAHILLISDYYYRQKDSPEPDFYYGSPAYQGIKQQIVKDSQFQLERCPSSDEEIYVGFGSFPVIGFSKDTEIMVSEFCHQHLFLENDGFGLGSEIKILSIDGVRPDEASVRDGTYPFVAEYYAAIRKGEEDDNGGRFLEWILSDEGQACIRQSGYFSF